MLRPGSIAAKGPAPRLGACSPWGGLATSDRYIASAQGPKGGFLFLEFLPRCNDPSLHLGQFLLVALDVGVLGADVAVELVPLLFEGQALLHQWAEGGPQGAGLAFGFGQELARLLAALLRLQEVAVASLQFSLAAGQARAAVAQAMFDAIELEQAHPQLLAHQQHQPQG